MNGKVQKLGFLINPIVSLAVASLGLNCNRDQELPTFAKTNGKIGMISWNSSESQRPIFEESFRLQTAAYDCQSRQFRFQPGIDPRTGIPIVRYVSRPMSEAVKGKYASSHGKVHGTTVQNEGFIGIVRQGEVAIKDVKDVRLDLHETMHVFTRVALGVVPSWFNEGFSILVASRLRCIEEKQEEETRFDDGHLNWQRVQKNEPLTFNNPLGAHQQGAIFFAALEEKGCDLDCAALIWSQLKALHSQGKKVNTALIKQVTTDITGFDLSDLFLKAQLGDRYDYRPLNYPVKNKTEK